MGQKWVGPIAGEFLGDAPGRIFELSNGDSWRQKDHTHETCWRDNPRAWLVWDQSLGIWQLDVEGASAIVRVSHGARKRGMGAS